MKMKISMFQGRNDLIVYLKWEKKVKLIFYFITIQKKKKVKLDVIKFIDFDIIWWD
jgi:hypothetical protein